MGIPAKFDDTTDVWQKKNGDTWEDCTENTFKGGTYRLKVKLVVDGKDNDTHWAEAIEYYNRGEELFLKGDIAAEAYSRQRDAMETDAREGIVQEYLDRLLPDTWDKMDIFERRNYLNGSEFGGVSAEGTQKLA